MRKSLGDLAVKVSNDSGIPEKEARHVVETVFSAVGQILEEGDALMVQNFGRFEVSYRGPRRYGFGSMERQVSPGRRLVKFKPAQRLTNTVQ